MTFSKLAVIVPLTFGETRMFMPLRRLISSSNWRTSSSLVCIVISPSRSNWISCGSTGSAGPGAVRHGGTEAARAEPVGRAGRAAPARSAVAPPAGTEPRSGSRPHSPGHGNDRVGRGR